MLSFVGIRDIVRTSKELPSDIRSLIADLLNAIDRPFDRTSANDPADYPASNDNPLCFFPTLPQQHGKASYAADRISKDATEKETCRKESYGHPTLTPGIFTVFCKHGICYGFQCMTSPESPKVPFEIFKTRFQKAPSTIIYDNSCKLHAYCLNREPHFFRSTRFYVDRMHWRGHSACSEGYCMNLYKASVDVNSINSQVNEQANAGLRHIQAQLSYMSEDNFMFHTKLYLAVKNIQKQQKLAVY